MKFAASWQVSALIVEDVTVLAFLMAPAYSIEGYSGRLNVEPEAWAVIVRGDGRVLSVPVTELTIKEVRASA